MELGEQPKHDTENKDLIVIIGESGAGKSVFVNYMAGAKMEIKHDNKTKLQVIDIKEEDVGHHKYSAIGHGDKSMTFIPVVINKEKVID